MYKHLPLLSRSPMVSMCFALFLIDSVYCLGLSMYMNPLVMLSCVGLLYLSFAC